MAKKPAEELPGDSEAPDEIIAHKNVGSAMAAIMAEIAYVAKRKAKTAGNSLNYAFLAEADLVGELHPLFVKHGLFVYPTGWQILHNEIYRTDNDKQMSMVRVCGNYRIQHGESGTEIALASLGEASDVSDKAVAKAQTIAYKYVLRQAFLLETGDDPDKAPSHERTGAGAGAAPPKGKAKADEQKANPASLEERFEKCRAALANAPNLDELEKYRRVYRKITFDTEQVKVLEAGYEGRKKTLETKKSDPKPETKTPPATEPTGGSDDDGVI